MADHLTPLDAAFLELEDGDQSSHMHVGWTLVFDSLPGGAPRVEQPVGLLEERLDLLPTSGGGSRRRAWAASRGRVGRGCRLRRGEPGAIRELPAPGGDTELLDWLGDFYSHRLDRAHPLWEMTLLDGLEGGRRALACKVHHAWWTGSAARS